MNFDWKNCLIKERPKRRSSIQRLKKKKQGLVENIGVKIDWLKEVIGGEGLQGIQLVNQDSYFSYLLSEISQVNSRESMDVG